MAGAAAATVTVHMESSARLHATASPSSMPPGSGVAWDAIRLPSQLAEAPVLQTRGLSADTRGAAQDTMLAAELQIGTVMVRRLGSPLRDFGHTTPGAGHSVPL